MFVDFDGTLSAIAPTPQAAVAVAGSGEALERLATIFRVVAVVSGRRADDAAERLGHPAGVRCFGLYGLEVAGGRDASPALFDAIASLLPRIRTAVSRVEGVLIEPKGAGLSVHYRLAPEPERARVAILERIGPIAVDSGLRVLEGKRVVELVPAGGPTKGDVVAREAAGLAAVLYAGDDVADLEAFRAVDDLAADPGVKVAVRTGETPPALVAAADLIVDGPSELVDLLAALGR